jgi:hypothetical protein
MTISHIEILKDLYEIIEAKDTYSKLGIIDRIENLIIKIEDKPINSREIFPTIHR